MTSSSSSSRTFTASSGTSSTKKKDSSSLNPETNLTRIGKLDNSASMQRAIERVSRERNVKKNDPPSVPRKEKRGTAAATVTTESSTASSTSSTSSASHSTGRGSVVASHVSSAKSLNGSSNRSKKVTDVSKKLSSTKSTRSTSLKNVTTRGGSGANVSSSSSSSSVSSKKSTVSNVNVMDTVLEETLDTFQNESFVNEKEMEGKKLNDKGDNNNDVAEKEEILQVETSIIKEENKSTVHDATPVESSGKVTTTVINNDMVEHRTGDSAVDDQERSSNSSSISSNSSSNNNDEGRDARDITRKLITDILRDGSDELSFEFQGFDVPVTYSTAVSYEMAAMTLESTAFRQWQDKMNRVVGPKRLEIRHVDIHSVDFMDDRVDMIKMNTTCVLIDEELLTEQEVLSGVCYLRDNYVAILIELFCVDDESSWAVLVDKPIVPIGSVTALELPVGKVDEDDERLLGFEIEEIEEAFGLEMNMFDMVNLSKEAYGHTAVHNDMGMCPSPALSGEHVKIMYLKKEISKEHLLMMRKKFSKQREDGALVSLRVIPLHDMWKVSVDMKVMCALFLLQKVNHTLLNKATHEEDHFDDDMSVFSAKGKRLVSNVFSSVYKGGLLPSRSMEL